ncbi:MAG: U32 family peptidase [Candidatus Nanoarchaeia archaeon]|nr:U32 family peptidase [Candidatus Nanoarchaeia archaeon]
MKKINYDDVEIMAPAGSYESLMSSINAGAKSIYFGVENLNMRSRAVKFTLKDIEKISKICKEKNVRSYLTINTLVYDDDLKIMKKLCDLAKKNKIDAIIASDISVLEYAKKINLETHISTQSNVSNFESVKFYSQYADVIVLARELNLNQIKKIINKIKKENIRGPSGNLLKIELFIHGALCVAIAGKCHMSLAQYNQSANRGECLQTCRREYLVKDVQTGQELIIDNKYVMSPKDLCTIEILDKIIESGVKILKIEGRARGPEYCDIVVNSYKKAIDLIKNKEYSEKNKKKIINNLENVFNRGFWQSGYYLGSKIGEWTNIYGSKAKKEKVLIGKIVNFYNNHSVAEIKIETKGFKINDEILIIGPTTGIVKETIKGILKDNISINKCKKNDEITIKTNKKVRKNDKVYLFVDRVNFQ